MSKTASGGPGNFRFTKHRSKEKFYDAIKKVKVYYQKVAEIPANQNQPYTSQTKSAQAEINYQRRVG